MDTTIHFNIVTSTASVCIFDPCRLIHRLDDPPDWWSDFMEEIDEINKGNAMIVGLGADGIYAVDVMSDDDRSERSVSALIGNQSGRIFIGPGEEITGGGFEPTTLRNRTGVFVDLEPAVYRVTVAKHGSNKLTVRFANVATDATNSIEDQLLLED